MSSSPTALPEAIWIPAKPLWGDGSVPSISQVIANGVPNPKDYRSAMPPMGGAQLLPTDVLALADYVWALNQKAVAEV
jgi:hypothetical protein